MRVDPELTYQDYKDGLIVAFNRLGKKGWEKTENITDYLTDEDKKILFYDTFFFRHSNLNNKKIHTTHFYFFLYTLAYVFSLLS